VFCRNCGGELPGTPAICSYCGAIPVVGSSYCQSCGAATHARDVSCSKCGAGLLRSAGVGIGGEVSPKSRLMTALLAFFVGEFGLHRLYLGKYGTGSAMLVLMLLGFATMALYVGFFLFLVVAAWAIVDLVLVLLGKTVDAQGRMVLEW
jgi:TM2 domain-containing membrane protein YozV